MRKTVQMWIIFLVVERHREVDNMTSFVPSMCGPRGRTGDRALLRELIPVVLAGVLIISACVGCASRIGTSDLAGTYHIIYSPYGKPVAEETLVLRPDGTYQQMFRAGTGPVRKSKGTWSFTSCNGQLRLDDFRRHVLWGHQIVPNPSPVGLVVSVSRRGSRMAFCVDPDFDFWYVHR